MTKQITIQTLNWGPCVVRMKITDAFKKLLLDEGEKNKIDFTDKLAGILDKETAYGEESKKKILPSISEMLGVYDQAYCRFRMRTYDKPPQYVLTSMWINYQKPNDFNPPHDHDGKLSFVAYLQIPEELKKENAAYRGKSCGPGGIQFLFGDGIRDCITYQSFFPEENDLFIFPSTLKHFVYPYKSKVERVSISGNIHFEDYKGKPLPIPMNYE